MVSFTIIWYMPCYVIPNTWTQIWNAALANHFIMTHLFLSQSIKFSFICEGKSDRVRISTHWGQVMHICICYLTIIDSDNGLSPDQHQAIIWTNAKILFIWPLGTAFSDISSEFKHFHWIKCIWKCCLQDGIHFVSASMCYGKTKPSMEYKVLAWC